MEVNGTHLPNLTLSEITKQYGQGPAVLSNLNQIFKPGTATGLIGPNGSGKTTLLRLLSVSSFPTSGHLKYGNLDVNTSPYLYLNHVGIVHDIASLPRYMTAVELLEYILRARSKWTEKSAEDINNLLNTLDLDDRRENLIGTYSSGMIKKTQIAAALIASPKILLLDEPFRGLDTQSLQSAVELLHTFKKNGAITVVSSHRRDVLDDLCDGFVDLGKPAMRSLNDIDWSSWTAIAPATLVFVIKDDKILLIRKKRGLGEGKINGPGGKLDPGETPLQCAIRETQEEIGITPLNLVQLGELKFQFADGYSTHVFVYKGNDYNGAPIETDEATPLWFPLDKVPYDEMWEDDKFWLPMLMNGDSFKGKFLFDEDVMLDHELHTVSRLH